MMVQMRNHNERLDGSNAEPDSSCEEFQLKMPELLGDGNRDHEHLKTCARCRALLEELEYIAAIAGDLLLPEYEPREAVWNNIVKSLPESSDNIAKFDGHVTESRAKN